MSSPFDRIDDRTAGGVMIGVAVAGIVVALLGAVIGWNLVGRLNAAAGDTLTVTTDALTTIENTIEVSDDVVGSTLEALEAVELTLSELVGAVETTQPLLESLGDLGEEAAPNLESASETLRSLEEVGDTIDGLLITLGGLPGVPRYNPDTSLGEQFGQLADDIEPLADTLRDTADGIGPTVEATADLQERLSILEGAVRDVRQDLTRSDDLLSEYSATATAARQVTEDTGRNLSTDVAAARVMIVLAALVFAAAQIVPFWFGRELRARHAYAPPA
jgi:methyl-accepting chemotaxis protein